MAANERAARQRFEDAALAQIERLTRERNDALTILAEVAALVEKPVVIRTISQLPLVYEQLRTILADPAGAIAKHEQEVRAGALREAEGDKERIARARAWIVTCVDPSEVGFGRKQAMLDYLDGGTSPGDISSTLYDEAQRIARADALTEGQP